LTEEWNLLPAATIEDPDAKKPEDWVNEEMMNDPEDVKPEGYDDVTSHLPDPDAIKPVRRVC
jgi:calreticulin